MGFVEHLNNNPIRIRAVKRSAAVTMDAEGMDNFDSARTKLLLQFFDSVYRLNDESQMI